MAARSADFFHVGAFDETLPIMEDADLCVRLHDAGPSPITLAAAAASLKGGPAAVPAAAVASGSAASSSVGGKPAALPVAAWHRRGRVRMILDRQVVTSGRRLAAWGNLRGTYIHFVIGVRWFLGASPAEMKRLYDDLYTDNYR